MSLLSTIGGIAFILVGAILLVLTLGVALPIDTSQIETPVNYAAVVCCVLGGIFLIAGSSEEVTTPTQNKVLKAIKLK